MRAFPVVLALIAACSSAHVGGHSASASVGTDVHGDVIRSDTAWSATGNPYRIHDTVQIAEGATLRIGPGVEVIAATGKSLFLLAGNVEMNGLVDAPISVDGTGSRSVFALVGKDVDRVGLTVNHARLSSAGGFLQTSGYAVRVQLTLSNSSLIDLPGYNYIWYPHDSTVSRNVFVNSGGFSVGVRLHTVTFESNRFQTASTTGYWIENWAAYDTAIQVRGNAFMAPGTPSVAFARGYSTVAIDASGNYWGTTDPAVIRQMVLDEATSIDRTGVITVSPVLSGEPSGVPAPVYFRPEPPTGVKATPSDGEAIVTWLSPTNTGGTAITGYTATASPGGQSCSTTGLLSCTVTGLTNGTAYTFTVMATNSAGTSLPSGPSAPVIPRTVPGAPTGVLGTQGNQQVSVSWSSPLSDGGTPILGYTVTASPGGQSCSTTGALSCTVTGLINGTAYTFTVTATNAAGTSVASAASAPATPTAPVFKPGAVTKLRATPAKGIIRVAWSPPSNFGGAPSVTYRFRVGKGKWVLTTRTNVRVAGGKGKVLTVAVQAVNEAGPGPTLRVKGVPR